MFFKKLFGKKSHHEYESKGDELFAAGRFADARIEFEEAFEKIGMQDDSSGVSEIIEPRPLGEIRGPKMRFAL